MTSPTITALLVLAMTPSAEIMTGVVTPDCCAPFPGSVSLSSDGLDLSVDPVSKPARLGVSRIETAETWVFPAGLPLSGAEVVQIVVVRPTSGDATGIGRGPLLAEQGPRTENQQQTDQNRTKRCGPAASQTQPTQLEIRHQASSERVAARRAVLAGSRTSGRRIAGAASTAATKSTKP